MLLFIEIVFIKEPLTNQIKLILSNNIKKEDIKILFFDIDIDMEFILLCLF